MTTYGAVESWGSALELPTRVTHLTRRGRIVRACVLLGVLLLAAIWATGRLTAAAVPTEGGWAPTGLPTREVNVQEGDSLWAIAQATAPTADPREVVMEIRELNGLTSNTIHPGQVLVVPSMR